MTDAAGGATPVPPAPGTAAARFAQIRDRVHGWLPGPVRRIIPATAVGFGALSSFTYAVDLTILYLLNTRLHVLYPVAVTTGYVIAFGLSFLLNRWLNFQSHGPVGRQTGRYVLTVVANYVFFILGLSWLLEAQFGVPPLAARLIAGACEAVFIYTMMRLYVFRLKRYR